MPLLGTFGSASGLGYGSRRGGKGPVSITAFTLGGGGGSSGGVGGQYYGSGGAGGVGRETIFDLDPGSSVSISIGAGGARAPGQNPGSPGGSTTFTSATTATGGNGSTTSRTGASNADFNGGVINSGLNTGGGAGAGANGSGGTGGAGVIKTYVGSPTYYGGGGGGGINGSGGAGGGGPGAFRPPGVGNGTNGLGGGAGGADSQGGNIGGSGRAIMVIPTKDYTGSVTGSPTVNTVGTNTVVQWTGAGSYTYNI